MLAGWTQRVFCRARRALQKSLWARPRQTLASGSKTANFSFDFNFNFNFRAEGRSGDPKFLRQKFSPTPNCVGSIIKIFAGGPPPPTPANFAGGGGVCNTKVYDIQQIASVYYGLQLYVRIVEPPPLPAKFAGGGMPLPAKFACDRVSPLQHNLLVDRRGAPPPLPAIFAGWGVCNTKVYGQPSCAKLATCI